MSDHNQSDVGSRQISTSWGSEPARTDHNFGVHHSASVFWMILVRISYICTIRIGQNDIAQNWGTKIVTLFRASASHWMAYVANVIDSLLADLGGTKIAPPFKIVMWGLSDPAVRKAWQCLAI